MRSIPNREGRKLALSRPERDLDIRHPGMAGAFPESIDQLFKGFSISFHLDLHPPIWKIPHITCKPQ